MSDLKPLASLSGSLLARKGQASPAMRRQNALAAMAQAPDPAEQHDHSLEDLGWNDMGQEPAGSSGFAGLSPMAPSPAAEPAQVIPHPVHDQPVPEVAPVPVVVHQQRELEEEFEAEVQVEAVVEPVIFPAQVRRTGVRAAPGSRGKAAFTLRLDPERHLRLRLVCAVRHRSAQQIVTEALDAFLAKQPFPADLSAAHRSDGGTH